jgi:predicted lipase
LATYNSIKDDVLAYAKSLTAKYPQAQVVVTGHSLGAAMSMLGAVDQQQNIGNIHFYSYGSPRVGEINWSDFFNGLIQPVNMRAVYRNDPFPATPFTAVLDYVHAGTEIHYYDCKNYLAYPINKDELYIPDMSAEPDHYLYPCIVTGEPI